MTTVVIVDDNKVDRYTVKRRLSKRPEFEEVLEFDAGDTFLTEFYKPLMESGEADKRMIVLMDINMPRIDGFETVQEMESCAPNGSTNNSCVVMMFSSSENPLDQERAARFDLVKGYIVKPFGADDVETLYYLM